MTVRTSFSHFKLTFYAHINKTRVGDLGFHSMGRLVCLSVYHMHVVENRNSFHLVALSATQ